MLLAGLVWRLYWANCVWETGWGAAQRCIRVCLDFFLNYFGFLPSFFFIGFLSEHFWKSHCCFYFQYWMNCVWEMGWGAVQHCTWELPGRQAEARQELRRRMDWVTSCQSAQTVGVGRGLLSCNSACCCGYWWIGGCFFFSIKWGSHLCVGWLCGSDPTVDKNNT